MTLSFLYARSGQVRNRILAQQWATVLKYTGLICVYISAEIDSTPFPRR